MGMWLGNVWRCTKISQEHGSKSVLESTWIMHTLARVHSDANLKPLKLTTNSQFCEDRIVACDFCSRVWKIDFNYMS